MAVIDVAGFMANLKEHAIDHAFHVHDERHFVETYSLRQTWEVDLHPEEACDGPLDLFVSLEVDPRVLLSFEDAVLDQEELGIEPDSDFFFPLSFTWVLPPLKAPPDLLVLATELSAAGGVDLPIDVSSISSIPSATDASEASLRISSPQQIPLEAMRDGFNVACETLVLCHDISLDLVERAQGWLE